MALKRGWGLEPTGRHGMGGLESQVLSVMKAWGAVWEQKIGGCTGLGCRGGGRVWDGSQADLVQKRHERRRAVLSLGWARSSTWLRG